MAIKSILLDTNAYTAFKRNQNEAVAIIGNVDIIVINPIILGELLGGFALGNKPEINLDELEKFMESPRVKVFPIDEKTSKYYALIYSQLRKKGKPIPTNDIWIAATAIQHNLILFTYDSDFENIENLKLGNCLADFL
ncbi:type II toxin-antitoxin system VapC family toxin [Anabaena cylindrica FACHB-243]|uniref:PilT protein domain protein n=1 Tax=Anabaena cylindrica (strain ATCC 27899 / PCC 7122) TaxID=272123 RepID=K9ZAD2_ANACC|nr:MULTISPECIES: type II toxin-antitoxin system VapC family toxin [Anabaena]AFZ56136.1 PilT protein domain protein [Anabaena cylindrica PCC 7122]MBD2417367.1 type II toxin-antitoxin system VapC family toxin [Anabaena cylindrica FACHB-243]MBY5282798.1 type II toxin-antitoxin system VapC family toxin [Anabaena sp. CCAP 1446/1C]MBY5307499.1 type II toxin-antitoxin system VapC family toxin [Anabaena sp. CCAP 1446/1C]MCM2404450.1 type II toxin-antitoxin system VapC family toxin [Anabaena sp. CCAP 1